jgi:hypothetical protein
MLLSSFTILPNNMFHEIRGPVRQLIAATDELSLDDIPTAEEVNDRVFVIGDVEEEGGMLKVLYDDDDSDDHSAVESDDESKDCKNKNKAVKKSQDIADKKGQDMAIKKGQDKDVERRQEKATNKGIYKGAQKIDTVFSATPTFIRPHVPSTPTSIPTSTSGDDNKLRSIDVYPRRILTLIIQQQ